MKSSKFILGMALPLLLLSACGPKPAGPSVDPDADFDPSNVRNQFIVHFHSEEKKYEDCALWLWPDGGDGNEYLYNAHDSYGGVSAVNLSTFGSDPGALKIGVISKSKGDWSWQTKDMFVETSTLTADSNGNYSIWLVDGDETIYTEEVTEFSKIKLAYFVDYSTIYVSVSGGKAKKVDLLADGEVVQEYSPASPRANMEIDLDAPADLTKKYSVRVTYEDDAVRQKPLLIQYIYDTDEFKNEFDYDGDLGALYSPESTTFKVWSPYSRSIKLKLYNNGTPTSVSATLGSDATYREVEMAKGEKGVWSATVNEDLEGKYYTYEVVSANYPEGKEVVDPYAKSAGINGLRGMVVDFSKTNPEGWDAVELNDAAPTSSVIYEAHVADVTSSPTWNGTAINAKKFLGLVEEGTSFTNAKGTTPTGFDYLKTLGFNALQLQPIFDQANDEVNPTFNWGYNPLNYNVLEGSYSSDPYDGYARIREFKEVVKGYADAGINIIMDVVYNHVNSVNGLNFDVLVPDYYFRLNTDGVLTNGSGCGNETADEHTMFQKFVIDSTKFWADEYKLGGFRFDLMGLHQVLTMNAVTAKLKETNPTVCVIGEPWAGGTSGMSKMLRPANQDGIAFFEGYGAFNDKMRDGLVSSGLNGPETLGFVFAPSAASDSKFTEHRSNIMKGLAGGTGLISADPAKAVQYVTCHDNRVLKDRFLAAREKNEEVTFADSALPSMSIFAQSFAMLSQGISFMQEGEEFLRTKGGSDNSYGGDPLSAEMRAAGYQDWYQVNELDYALAIEHADMVDVYKDLINLKVNETAFHKATSQEAKDVTVTGPSSSKGEIIVDIVDGDNVWRIAFANGFENPAAVDFAGYELILDTKGLTSELTAETPMANYQTIVAYKRG